MLEAWLAEMHRYDGQNVQRMIEKSADCGFASSGVPENAAHLLGQSFQSLKQLSGSPCSDSIPAQLTREGSCPLPGTPPLPSIRIRRSDSSSSSNQKHDVDTPAAAAVVADAAACHPDAQKGWFFSCRGCGCLTAYECKIGGADVPFCRRCQVMLTEANPTMQNKMVNTLIYVHEAWSNAGL